MPRVSRSRLAREEADLLSQDVTARTAAWYASLLQAFETYLRMSAAPELDTLALQSPSQLMLWATDFVQRAYGSRAWGRTEAGGFISALRRRVLHLNAVGNMVADCRGGFAVLWRMYRAWRNLEPEEFRTPVPYEMVHALAVVYWLDREFTMALVVLLMFHGLLRVQEGLKLRWNDLVLYDAEEQLAFGRPPGLIRIHVAKMRGRGLGRQQFVILDCEWLCRALLVIQRSLSAEAREATLFLGTESRFRRLWSSGLDTLRLRPLNLMLGGLRGGGAVHSYLQDLNVPRVRRLGRWSREETLERYLQEGIYHMLGAQLPEPVRQRIGTLARHAPQIISGASPPTTPMR